MINYVRQKSNIQSVRIKIVTMETLKYKVITAEKQYDDYCNKLEALVFSKLKTVPVKDEIALLTLLIEKWDEEHSIFNDLDPVELLRSLLKDHQLKSIDLAKKLKVSPGLISDIINYKKGFSKDIIRQLAAMFKLSQEAFNRPYPLKPPGNDRLAKASKTVKTKKKTAES
jgi:HTH-type transcriptional regulator / antitoxin HigA